MTPRGVEVDFVQFYRGNPGRPFKVEVTTRNGDVIATTMKFPDAVAAQQYGLELANDPVARVEVRPA